MGFSAPSSLGSKDLSTGSSASSSQGSNSMSNNKNQHKRHHHQVGDKRKHPSDDENCAGHDRLSVTAGHEFDITEDDEDDLSHYHEEREVNTPEEGP